jgi:tellurite resistance protein
MSTLVGTPQGTKALSLEFVPINLFAAVMGLCGLSLAWRLAHKVFGSAAVIGDAIGALAVLAFLLIALTYLAKWIKYPAAVAAEFKHPVAGNLFGTFTIALLLLSPVLTPFSALLGQIVWIAGTVTTLVLGYIVVSRLLTVKQDPAHAAPVWLIPGVATLDIVVAGGTMPFAWALEVNLFATAVGTVLALAFFTLILSRLMHHEPLPATMLPSMIILIAPFEVGFLAYTNLVGHIDMFATLLFYFGLALFVVLFFKVFRTSTPFGLSWWAVSFPMAALGNAALKYADAKATWPTALIAALVLALISIVIGVILLRTLHHLFTGRLFRG